MPPQVRRLIVAAALDYTRLRRKMRRACRLILLHGKRPAEAARIVGANRQDVHRAMIRVREKLREVESYIGEKNGQQNG